MNVPNFRPLNAAMKQEMLDRQGDIKFAVPWTTLAEYLDHLVQSDQVTAAPIPLQTLLHLRFRLPAAARDPETELVIEAMGVRKGVKPDLASPLSHLQGLYFLDLHGQRYERLRRFLWDRSGGTL
jgi:hypothetical protein